MCITRNKKGCIKPSKVKRFAYRRQFARALCNSRPSLRIGYCSLRFIGQEACRAHIRNHQGLSCVCSVSDTYILELKETTVNLIYKAIRRRGRPAIYRRV
ncbi:hypothetical protein Mapa_014823 [Marchantia paleacea]|nr:hypothetical protein Mapa_014823 [Marchantia paleacea]